MKNSTLLHIPHASTAIPARFLSSFDRSKLPHEIAVMTDWFCDELFDCGRDRIVFPVSRLLCDVERFREDKDEIMAQIGMGVTYRSTSDLKCLRKISETEREEILLRYYDAHHKAFTDVVTQKLDVFGRCTIIDCHSFYPTPLPYEMDQNPNRPDFCIGTSAYHTPEILVDNLVRFLLGRGYSVKIDSPFAGTIVPIKYFWKDRRVCSVMIEVNRRLYMNPCGEKSKRFSTVNSVLAECAALIEQIAET